MFQPDRQCIGVENCRMTARCAAENVDGSSERRMACSVMRSWVTSSLSLLGSVSSRAMRIRRLWEVQAVVNCSFLDVEAIEVIQPQ